MNSCSANSTGSTVNDVTIGSSSLSRFNVIEAGSATSVAADPTWISPKLKFIVSKISTDSSSNSWVETEILAASVFAGITILLALIEYSEESESPSTKSTVPPIVNGIVVS